MKKKKNVKRLIIIPMVFLAVICVAVTFLTSLIVYRNKVHSSAYDLVDYAYITVEFTMTDIGMQQRRIIEELSSSAEFHELFESGAVYDLFTFIRPTYVSSDMDYGIVTDSNGNVILRTHDTYNAGDSLLGIHQIDTALEGSLTTYLVGDDEEPLRLLTCAPIINADGEIAGTITAGRTLTARAFTNALKTQTGCELTFFDANSNVASSTLPFPGLSYLDDSDREDVLKAVMSSGGTFTGLLEFRDNPLLSKVFPLHGHNGQVTGMLFIGVPVSNANSELLGFIIPFSIVAIVLIAFGVFEAIFVNKIVSGIFDKMENYSDKRDKLFNAVNEASVVLLQIDETDDIRPPLVTCMGLIGTALGVDHVHLWRAQSTDEGVKQFVREYSWVSDYGKRRARTPKYLKSTSEETKFDWMEKFNKNEYISGILADMDNSYRELLKSLEVRSIAMLPVFLEGHFWGMFSIDNIQDARHYSDDEVHILRSVSLMMASVVRRHDLQNENLKVYFDALTGINNRRYFDKNMARIISSLSRAGSELGLMMIDVDFFKKYNDTYGHGAGDECLIKVAEILAESVNRVDDFVARYGGEEFVVVMPNTDRDGAVKVAKRIVDKIREAAIEHIASEVADHVTVSIGATTGKVTQYHTAESFVNRADDLLYKSKHTGRNKYTYGVLK